MLNIFSCYCFPFFTSFFLNSVGFLLLTDANFFSHFLSLKFLTQHQNSTYISEGWVLTIYVLLFYIFLNRWSELGRISCEVTGNNMRNKDKRIKKWSRGYIFSGWGKTVSANKNPFIVQNKIKFQNRKLRMSGVKKWTTRSHQSSRLQLPPAWSGSAVPACHRKQATAGIPSMPSLTQWCAASLHPATEPFCCLFLPQVMPCLLMKLCPTF